MENLSFQLSWQKETAQYTLAETVENILNTTISTLNTYPECSQNHISIVYSLTIPVKSLAPAL